MYTHLAFYQIQIIHVWSEKVYNIYCYCILTRSTRAPGSQSSKFAISVCRTYRRFVSTVYEKGETFIIIRVPACCWTRSLLSSHENLVVLLFQLRMQWPLKPKSGIIDGVFVRTVCSNYIETAAIHRISKWTASPQNNLQTFPASPEPLTQKMK